MESQRSLLVIAFAIVSFFLWQDWQKDYGPKPPTPVVQNQPSSPEQSNELQLSASGPAPTAEVGSTTNSSQGKIVEVHTDVMQVRINTRGGDIVGLELPKFTLSLTDKTPYPLMRQINGFNYTAQSGLLGDGPDEKGQAKPIYQVSQEKFELANGQQELVVALTLNHQGLQIEKRYTFTAGKYDVRVEYVLQNQSNERKLIQPYYYLAQTIDNGKPTNMMMPVYRGGAYGTTEQRYEKFAFEDMAENSLNQSTLGGWISMLEHYFVAAWVPTHTDQNQLFSIVNNGEGIMGVRSPQMALATGEQKTVSATLYAGPKDQDSLAKIAQGLDLTVDYGLLWFISQPLFWLLQLIYGVIANWGWAIIGITILIKALMFPLTKAQYESMAKMRNLKPKMDELQARYKDDKQKMGPAMMELYRKEKVNPMGGCLPMLIQMPIFLALYWVFVESVELRQAPFILWIHDLSAADPYFVLPLLYIVSMYVMQKLTPMTVTDPMQQKIMLWMPVVFGVFFIWFPSGLVLYWVISNLISLAQMLYIYRNMEKKGLYKRNA